MWYTREEQALVIGAFYSMNGFQQCVGGLIAYGIAQVQHARLKNWQILFTVSKYSHLLESWLNVSFAATRLHNFCMGALCPLVASR